MTRFYGVIILGMSLLFSVVITTAGVVGNLLAYGEDIIYILRPVANHEYTDLYLIDHSHGISMVLARMSGVPPITNRVESWNEYFGFTLCNATCDVMMWDGDMLYNLTNTEDMNELFVFWHRDDGGFSFTRCTTCNMRVMFHGNWDVNDVEYIDVTELPPLGQPLP